MGSIVRYNRHESAFLHYFAVKFLSVIEVNERETALDQGGMIFVSFTSMKLLSIQTLLIQVGLSRWLNPRSRQRLSPFIRGLCILAFILLTPRLVSAQRGTQSAQRALEQSESQLGVGSRVQSGRNAEQETQYHRARTAWESGISLLEAKARIDRVLAQLPEDTDALKLRVSILMGLGRKEEAIDDALLVVQLDATDGEGQLLLCETAMANGNPAIARRALESASDLIVTGVPFLIRLSTCALSAKETARSEALARIAVAQNERDPRGQIQLARIFLKTGRAPAAMGILDRIIEEGLVTRSLVTKDAEFASLYDGSTKR
ncbi:hypothetical protein HQ496_00570 [bacterium]|nr:hypothetical protein [bacterium]